MVLCLPENLLFMETYAFTDNKNCYMYWEVSIVLQQADRFHLSTPGHLIYVVKIETL